MSSSDPSATIDCDQIERIVASLFSASPEIAGLYTRERGGADGKWWFSRPLPAPAPTDAELAETVARVLENRRPPVLEAGALPGPVFQLSLCAAPALGPSAVLMIAADVTARKRTEEHLRRSMSLLVDTQGVAHLGTWEWDVSEPNARWSDELYRIYALSPDTHMPSYEAYLEMVHPDDRQYVREATERVFTQHEPFSHDERIIRRDGTIRYLHTWAYPILDDEKKLVRLVGVCQDITDRKSAENALFERAGELARSNERLRTEIAERARVEARLRDAHKLEAIGRLAGGIAHDFNNLLSVVLGRSGLLERSLDSDSPLRQHATEIADVARQAARLTHQLLIFSREQVAHKEVLELGTVIQELSQMLRRLVGEDIEFETMLADERLTIVADQSQLEQVIMNLVVNARDAMPSGGRLTIALDGAVPADCPPSADLDPVRRYAVITVTDTGVGMDEATVARVFDPYFTTKPEGHGLGLSTVYGIVRELGGAITVVSSPGKGARFTVFVPRSERTRHPAPQPTALEELRGSAVVLLVEDQASVRRLVREQLEELGYRVFDAATPAEATAIASREPAGTIDLVVTDLVMPQMNGVELARRLGAALADLKGLFISGWANEKLLAEIEDRRLPYLRKPFTMDALARAVRDALQAADPLSRAFAASGSG